MGRRRKGKQERIKVALVKCPLCPSVLPKDKAMNHLVAQHPLELRGMYKASRDNKPGRSSSPGMGLFGLHTASAYQPPHQEILGARLVLCAGCGLGPPMAGENLCYSCREE